MVPFFVVFSYLFLVSSGLFIRSLAESISNYLHLNCTPYEAIVEGFGITAERGSVCCANLGCFSNEKTVSEENGTKSTVWSHFPKKPMCADEINPEFHLFTKEGKNSHDEEYVIEYSMLNFSVNACPWKNLENVFVVIHGWKTDWPSKWMILMKDALISDHKSVILVRWSNGSNTGDYGQGAANTRVVGAAVAYFLKQMIHQKKLDFSSLTVVGFSLGAHIAGFAAKLLPGLPKLIGLDPAGPLFSCEDPRTRIAASDAKFVQIFHTNGDNPLKTGRGTMEKLGHLDYYVNGGRGQPDCDNGAVPKTLQDVFSLSFSNLWSSMSCSHQRAPAIFTELIKNQAGAKAKDQCKFLAFACNGSRQWHSGQCFSCSENFQCIEPKYDAPEAYTKIHGNYYFNLRYDGAQAEEFCGRQVALEILVDRKVTGDMTVNLENKLESRSGVIPFIKKGQTLYRDKIFGRIITLPWDMSTDINVVYLSYKRSTGMINWLLSRNHEFVLQNMTFHDLSAKRLTSCNENYTISDKPVTVKLKPRCFNLI